MSEPIKISYVAKRKNIINTYFNTHLHVNEIRRERKRERELDSCLVGVLISIPTQSRTCV